MMSQILRKCSPTVTLLLWCGLAIGCRSSRSWIRLGRRIIFGGITITQGRLSDRHCSLKSTACCGSNGGIYVTALQQQAAEAKAAAGCRSPKEEIVEDQCCCLFVWADASGELHRVRSELVGKTARSYFSHRDGTHTCQHQAQTNLTLHETAPKSGLLTGPTTRLRPLNCH